MIGLSFKVGHLVLFLLFTIEVNASKEDLVTRNVGNVTKFRDVLFGIPGEQPTETQLLARRKRGSLDPIVGLKVRPILQMKKIKDQLTTMDNKRGFRTTFWPLMHKAPPKKDIPFWCLFWIFCWPLLCLYCCLACGLTWCYGHLFRKANCLLDSLGFCRTCCLMNFCFCCALRVARKCCCKHVNTEDDPCCQPAKRPSMRHYDHGDCYSHSSRSGNSRTNENSRMYDVRAVNLAESRSPFSRGANTRGFGRYPQPSVSLES